MIIDTMKLAFLYGAGWVMIQMINASQAAAVYDHVPRLII